jgi:hypothetical protein
MAFKMNKSAFNFGEGTNSSPNKKNNPMSVSDFLPRQPVAVDKKTGKIKLQNPFGYDEDAHWATKMYKDNLGALVMGPMYEQYTTMREGYKDTIKPGLKNMGYNVKDVEISYDPKRAEREKQEKIENTKAKVDEIRNRTAELRKRKENYAKATKQKGSKAYGGTRTWAQGQAASGGNLNALVAQRKKLKKGTPEYATIQNKINKALGSKKRH